MTTDAGFLVQRREAPRASNSLGAQAGAARATPTLQPGGPHGGDVVGPPALSGEAGAASAGLHPVSTSVAPLLSHWVTPGPSSAAVQARPALGGPPKPVQCDDYGAPQVPGAYGDFKIPIASDVEKLIKLKKAADKMADLLTGKSKDKNVLEAARTVLGFGQSVGDFARVLSKYSPEEVQRQLSGVVEAGKVAGKAKDIAEVLDLVTALADNSAMQAFIDDPSPENAAAWATHVGDTFDKAKIIVKLLPEIPFVSDMLKGYLSAPANYIKAYLAIHNAYIAKIDRAGDIKEKGAATRGAAWGNWDGALSYMFFLGHNQGRLAEFMNRHRKIQGVAIDKDSTPKARATVLLMNKIREAYQAEDGTWARDGMPVSEVEVRSWTEFITSKAGI